MDEESVKIPTGLYHIKTNTEPARFLYINRGKQSMEIGSVEMKIPLPSRGLFKVFAHKDGTISIFSPLFGRFLVQPVSDKKTRLEFDTEPTKPGTGMLPNDRFKVVRIPSDGRAVRLQSMLNKKYTTESGYGFLVGEGVECLDALELVFEPSNILNISSMLPKPGNYFIKCSESDEYLGLFLSAKATDYSLATMGLKAIENPEAKEQFQLCYDKVDGAAMLFSPKENRFIAADQFIFDSLYPYGEKSKFDLFPTVQMDSNSGKEEGTFLLLPVCNDVDRPLRVGCWTKFTFEPVMNR